MTPRDGILDHYCCKCGHYNGSATPGPCLLIFDCLKCGQENRASVCAQHAGDLRRPRIARRLLLSVVVGGVIGVAVTALRVLARVLAENHP